MHILYGISGFGNGHVARSAGVIDALLARGHRLAVMGFDNSERYIRTQQPSIPCFRLKVPVLHPAPHGLDFGKIADDPANHYADGIQLNYRAMQDTLDYFGGAPHLVLSDYELVSAQFAYATLTPLVTIDQHSKFPGFQFPPVDGYTNREDYARLNLFYPYADARFATSFFKIPYPPNPRFAVTLIPPILRQEILSLNNQAVAGEVLVYISPFARFTQDLDKLYRLFEKFPAHTFHVFRPDARPLSANVQFHIYDTSRFLDILGRAEAVISTAGHNLLSELAYLKKPAYVVPSATFDQQLCALVIEQNQLGMRHTEITEDSLATFFSMLPTYQHNLQASQGLVDRFDGVTVLMEHLHQQFGV